MSLTPEQLRHLKSMPVKAAYKRLLKLGFSRHKAKVFLTEMRK